MDGQQLTRPYEDALFPWVPKLKRRLTGLLPPFSGESIFVFSDYAGSSRQSKFSTLSFLFLDLDNCCDRARAEVRARHFSDSRRMSFKGLNDRQKQAALIPFLRSFDHQRGVCIALCIEKCVDELQIVKFQEAVAPVLKAKWKSKSLANMVRAVHFLAFVLGLIAREKQNIYWISDQDEMHEGTKQLDTQRLMSSFSSLYISYKEMGGLYMGTTSIDEGDRFEEDYAAVPDLVAGAFAELMSGLLRRYGRIPSVDVIMPSKSSYKSELISSWFFESNSTLSKIAVLMCRDASGASRVGPFRFE